MRFEAAKPPTAILERSSTCLGVHLKALPVIQHGLQQPFFCMNALKKSPFSLLESWDDYHSEPTP
jgi:hypothetical protein